jgi:biopolymer transport protein ExbB
MSTTQILHEICFGVLIAAAFIAVAVGIERIIFSLSNLRRAKMMLKQLSNEKPDLTQIIAKDAVSTLVMNIFDGSKIENNAERQDYVDAGYIHARDELSNRMWILDTVVTAAPLLGLLGTIFGIVETFLVLAESGMSDPSGVSAGIGTALYATALGIAVALFGLLIFNYLTNKNEKIAEYMKMLILKVPSSIKNQ